VADRASPRAFDGGFALRAADPSVHVLAGWYEGLLVGIALVRRAGDPTASPARVEVLFVEPAMRGVGVGEALLVGAVEWCAAQGCSGVDVTALPGDRATKSLLERCGFRARAVVMHRLLPG
jgi:GNAT superfamily N-acetyltransferase